MSDRFSFREVAAEGIRNLQATLASTSLSIIVIAGVAMAVLGGSWWQTSEIFETWQTQRIAGYDIYSVRATSGDRMEASRCDQLRYVEGVISAGGILRTTSIRPQSNPSSAFWLVTATSGTLPLLFPEEPAARFASVIAGALISSELGLSPQSEVGFLTTRDSGVRQITVDVATSSTSRIEQFDNTVLVAGPAVGKIGECLVESTPSGKASVNQLLRDWFPQQNVQVTSFVRTSQTDRDPVTELRQRTGQWLPLLSGVAVGALIVTLWWARRAEFAVYRLLGLGRQGLAVLLTVETFWKVWLPTAIGAGIAIVVFAPMSNAVVATAMLHDLLSLSCILTSLPLIGVFLLSTHTAFDLVKGR